MKSVNLIITGIIYLVLGLLALFQVKELSPIVVAGILAFGAIKLTFGANTLYQKLVLKKQLSLFSLIQATINLFFGLIVITSNLFNFMSSPLIAKVIAIWLIMHGILKWLLAFKVKREKETWWYLLILAFSFIIYGILIYGGFFNQWISLNQYIAIFFLFLCVGDVVQWIVDNNE